MTTMAWEITVMQTCDATGAVCRHSRQSPSGERYNFEMTCEFVPSWSRRLYSVAYGETNARLHCIGCGKFSTDYEAGG